jgi:hypothetical protein
MTKSLLVVVVVGIVGIVGGVIDNGTQRNRPVLGSGTVNNDGWCTGCDGLDAHAPGRFVLHHINRW